MEKVEVLRLEILKKFQTKDISALKKDVFRTGFYENMEKFYNDAKHDYSNVPQRSKEAFKASLKTCFVSNSFKKIFHKFNLEGYSLDSMIVSLISSEKSISKFLNNQKTNSVTHDFFSVFLGYKGFNDFIKNHKIYNPISCEDMSHKSNFEQTTIISHIENQKSENEILNFANIDLNFFVENQIMFSETLIDAFEFGLSLFFINFFDNLKKSKNVNNNRKNVNYHNMFSTFFENWNLKRVFCFENLNFYTKRLKVKNINSEGIVFDRDEVQMIFNIGNKIAHRIYNRVIIELYDDTEELERVRFDIDNDIIAISAWLDLEYIYQDTIESYHVIEPSKFLEFISVFKGMIREKYFLKNSKTEKLNDFIAKVYMFGFESKLDEIIKFENKKKYQEVDSFISDIIKTRSIENILYFTSLVGTDDLTIIKNKIQSTSLKDYFRLGELIAQDLIGCLVFSSKLDFKSEDEFKQTSEIRNVDEIKYQFTMLNLTDVYNKHMPVLNFKDGKCILKGNFNLLLIKILKRIKSIN